MSVQERIHRYRTIGGAADLARIEVLVTAAARDEVIAS